MYRTLIIQLCQGKDSFPFYGTFKFIQQKVEKTQKSPKKNKLRKLKNLLKLKFAQLFFFFFFFYSASVFMCIHVCTWIRMLNQAY